LRPFVYICIALVLSLRGYTQSTDNSFRWFGLNSVSGEVNILGEYRQQDRVLKSSTTESLEGSMFSGGLSLKSSGYIGHPNLLLLSLDADYSPQKTQENYLVIPDRSEVRTLQRLYLNGNFLKQKPVSLNCFINLNNSYINKEDLTNIRLEDRKYGGTFSVKNKYIPLSVSYTSGKWNQEELISDRTFKNEHTNIQGRINKSFTSRDNHKLSYSYNDYFREDNVFTRVQNRTQEVILSDNIYLDQQKKYYFNSLISGFDQEGINNYQRIQARENIHLKLPKRLQFNTNYFYNNIKQDIYSSQQHQIRTKLSHELYLSLKTSIYFEYSDLSHTVYNEKTDRQGIDIKYTKKIPKGQLSLSYHYFRYNQKMDSEPVILQVLMESHVLADNEIVLLNKEYIDLQSIVVKDASGTVIYQENLDYILIERNSLVEIQRIPGGQIADGQTVYVDYANTRNDSFKYVTNNNTFNTNISFLSRLVEFYFRLSDQTYTNIEISDYVTLNYYTQYVVGTRVNYKIFSAGIEYDNYNSELIPYKLYRYFLRVQGRIRNKFLYTLNGNYRDYKIINDNKNQKFADVSARLAYNINTKSKINFEASYRNQKGQEIDLNLLTLRGEYSAIVRHIYFKVGVEMYNRDYLNEQVDFLGGYVKIARRF